MQLFFILISASKLVVTLPHFSPIQAEVQRRFIVLPRATEEKSPGAGIEAWICMYTV